MRTASSNPNMDDAATALGAEEIGDTFRHDEIPAAAFEPVQFRCGQNVQGTYRGHAAPFPGHQYAAGPSNLPHRPPILEMNNSGTGKSSGRKRKSGEKERIAIVSKISDYLTTGQKEQMMDLAGAITDLNDMGIVM